MITVLNWAVNNDHIPKAYTDNLKIKKGAESSREAFTQVQVERIMSYTVSLPESDWKRWGISLAVITGARLDEILQLTKEDIKQVGGCTVIDINDSHGKDIKNKYSVRQVPLIDKAYGLFDLQAFLRFVDASQATVLGVTYSYAGVRLNRALREATGEHRRELVFHSLRHSLSTLLKEAGTREAYAQAIIGHSSGTITYDRYGSGASISVGKLAEVLESIFIKVV